jgi:nucleoside-diphosphate-sugar epimerase
LSGLVGPDRHPGKFLAGKTRQLSDGDARVNLIHQQDASGLILALLNNENVTGVFNGVSETQATKKEYYQSAAKSLSLLPPKFDPDTHSDNIRIVSGYKAKRVLGYHFVYPDLLSWL